MSLINTANNKQPFKLIEIPLNKFTEEAVPHHEAVFERHKTTVQNLLAVNNIDQLKREFRDKKRTIRQLKDLMYELDTLRTQVEHFDLDKFDTRTLSVRKTILMLINGYTRLENTSQARISQEEAQSLNSPQSPVQLQLQKNIDEIRLDEANQQLNRVEDLHRDIDDLQGIFVDLHQMVDQQKEQIDVIETNTISASENISRGLKHLISASKLKTTAYPVTGALLGTLIGGPIGLIAGLKIGGAAAVGFGLAGFTGGKLIKNMSKCDEPSDEINVDENVPPNVEKKNI